METEGRNMLNGLMYILEWAVTLAYLNLLWIVFTIAGGILLGIGPSTIAVFSLIRKKIRVGSIVKPVAAFYQLFKENFKLGNKYFAVTGATGIFLYIDFQIIQLLPNTVLITYAVIPAFIILLILWVIVSLFTLGMITHYTLDFWDNIKQAFWIAMISPASSFVMLIAVLLNGFIINILPAAFLFYLITPSVFIVESIFLRKIKTIENKKTK